MKRFSADISSASPLSERETSISLQSRLTSFVRAKQGSPVNTNYNKSWEPSKETMKNGSQGEAQVTFENYSTIMQSRVTKAPILWKHIANVK